MLVFLTEQFQNRENKKENKTTEKIGPRKNKSSSGVTESKLFKILVDKREINIHVEVRRKNFVGKSLTWFLPR